MNFPWILAGSFHCLMDLFHRLFAVVRGLAIAGSLSGNTWPIGCHDELFNRAGKEIGSPKQALGEA